MKQFAVEIKAGAIYIFSSWLNIWAFMNNDLVGSILAKLTSFAALVYYCIRIYKESKGKKDVG